MTIQAVFFDMGGTIETFWHTRELRLEATSGIQQRLLDAGIDLHLSNEQLYEVVSSGLESYHQWSVQSLIELSPVQVWSEYVLMDYPVDSDRLAAIAEDLMFYYETRYYHREMRPEVPSVLEALREKGLKIGLISNVCSHGQVFVNLEQYGIRRYFNPVVLSSGYGRRKPDPSIFHYAARLANTPTSKCVYVGDRIARDINGARRAGYRLAIQIRHEFEHGEHDEGRAPDAVIDQMTELLAILEAERGKTVGNLAGGASPIRAILFDAGDILYYRPHRGRQLSAFLKELSLDGDKTRAVEKKSLKLQAYQGQINHDAYLEAMLRLSGVTRPEQIERGKRILDEDNNNIRFFEGVQKTLIALKDKGYLLGIVTDTAMPVHVKLSWFERGGFGHVWDTIISSKELGVCKPDPQIYQAALHQLGQYPSQAVFVGHNAAELEGAAAVGMKTIAFNYEKAAKANFYINKFADLLDVPLIAPSQQILTV